MPRGPRLSHTERAMVAALRGAVRFAGALRVNGVDVWIEARPDGSGALRYGEAFACAWDDPDDAAPKIAAAVARVEQPRTGDPRKGRRRAA